MPGPLNEGGRLVLLPNRISLHAEALLGQRFSVVRLYEQPAAKALPSGLGEAIRVVAVGAAAGFPDWLWDRLPNLQLIAVHGVGTDRIDLARARKGKVRVTTSPNVLADDVADLAIALWLALSRRLLDADRYVRTGQWNGSAPFPLTAKASGQRAGIVGLGHIGSAIARRLQPFTGSIAYTGRGPKPDAPYIFSPTIEQLAARSDVLFLTAAAEPDAPPLVGGRELAALGPQGLLINVARGALVDEAALIEALSQRRLGGAGLDVFANEPAIDPRFSLLSNVILQPHQGSATDETRRRMASVLADQIDDFFNSRAAETPPAN